MQIITKLKPHDNNCLAISWEPGEDPIYEKLLSESEQCVLHIESSHEIISDFCFKERKITSKLLKKCFYVGAEIVLSNCCPKTRQTDKGLYLWHCEEDEELDSDDLFQKVLSGLDINNLNPDTIKLMMFMLQENKHLVQDNYKMRETCSQLENEVNELRDQLRDQNNRFLFSNKSIFTHWISDKMSEIERGCSLLQRNFPRHGLQDCTKFHVDYLFQDGNRQHLLADVLYYDRRLRQDPMTNICCLKQAQQVLSKELSISSKYIRRMIITNELSNGLADLCTINQIELISISGDYSVERWE